MTGSKRMPLTHVDAQLKQAGRLIGSTVVGLAKSKDGKSFALMFRQGRKAMTVWVDSALEIES